MASRIILASQSPRRQELLRQIGVGFTVQVADIDESVLVQESVDDYVLRVAKLKAAHIAKQHADAIVIAADTTVTLNQHILTKSIDRADAFRMWTLLSNTHHLVKTCVVVTYKGQVWCDTVSTKVHMKELTTSEMEWYWNTGEPKDKAGAYAIQGLAGAWVKSIEGSYSNVVGLPLYETMELIKQAKQIV